MVKTKFVLAAMLGLVLMGSLFIFASGIFSKKQISPDMLYKMVLCPCCGETVDTRCCGMAQERREFINAQLASGMNEQEVLMKVAERYGVTSLTGPKKKEIEAEFEKKNPQLFPKDKLSFESAVGKKAPDFQLESIDGSKVKLSDYKGKTVVLFFTEGSMCYPSCWNQIEELGKDERFNSEETAAFSIVVDPKSEWEKIVAKVPGMANSKILFDTTRGISSSYDVLSLKSSMHPGQYPGHTYFIVDKEGIIRYAFDDPKMAVRNNLLAEQIDKLG